MTIQIRPDIQRLIDEEISAGHFPSAEAVVEAAVYGMCHVDETLLDDDALAAIKLSREQLARGEGIEFDEVRAYWKKRLSGT